MKNSISLTGISLLLAVSNLSAATHYVSQESTNPTPPYTNWLTAATNIQDAVDAAAGDDEVVVTNGVYPGGVTVANPIVLLSVNGPQVTIVSGGGPCVSLTDGASLTGFTVKNGRVSSPGSGGGVLCASTNAFLTNCMLTANSAELRGGGAYGGTLYNCTLSYNSGGGAYTSTLYNCTLNRNSHPAGYTSGGGGVASCTLYNCTLTGNSAGLGGGAESSTLYDCVLTGNSADFLGGAALSCRLSNCRLAGNFVTNATLGSYQTCGGGAQASFLTNCTLTGNWASWRGGGAAGCTLYNCALTNNSALATVGPDGGGGALDCRLYDCILVGNSSGYGGGGASRCTLYDCTLSSNQAVGAYSGAGGALNCNLYNCALTGNSAFFGGGAFGGSLYNCTLTGNSATMGGGASGSILYNCILYFNTQNYEDWTHPSTLKYCCTTPLPDGIGNITNEPLFVDSNGWSNLRPQSNSPCINAGNNVYVTNSTDFDGNPRIISGTVDIGAYEYQGTGSRISYAWLQQNGLPTDGSADLIDSDGDGMNNWQEWVCGTCPTNAQSVLRMVSATPAGAIVILTWQSVAGINYFLERSANPGSPFTVVATNIVGQAGVTGYADANATGAGPFFYRVGVQGP